MARYFLDTNCLIGLTFGHDVWFPESDRLFSTNNTLYTGKQVVKEYCNTVTEGRDPKDVTWSAEEGVYGRIISELKMNQLLFDQTIQLMPPDDLTVSSLTQEFVEQFNIMPESEDRIKRYFDDKLAPGFSTTEARDAANHLIDLILEVAEKNKMRISRRVTTTPERDQPYSEMRERIQIHIERIHSGDVNVLLDAYHLCANNILTRVVTADKNHIYGNRELINNLLGLDVMFIRDEFQSW